MTEETRKIQITDPDHLITLGTTMGLLQAIEVIKAASIEKGLPGFSIAKFAVIAEEAGNRILLMQENLRLAMRTWGDITGYGVKCSGGGELSLEPEPPEMSP